MYGADPLRAPGPKGHTPRMFTGRSGHTNRSDEHLESARERPVDEATGRHLDWRRQSSMCEFAYRRWVTAATSRDGAIAFAAFTAALDREERAAAEYETALRDSERLSNAAAHPKPKGAKHV